MTAPRASRWTRAYGASGWHLALMVASLGAVAYVLHTIGLRALWDPEVWWQSIAVWFVGAVLLHDLVLFPAYSLVDRLLRARHLRGGAVPSTRQVSLLNYVRVPTLAAGLTFLLFSPGILRWGDSTFSSATGLDQDPFLGRWLVLAATAYLISGLLYAVARLRAAKNAAGADR